MIRYRITPADLAAKIDAVATIWRADALIRKTAMLNAAAFDGGNTWFKIKSVFMRLQHYKCIYCETSLQQGTIAHDLEHFRPKNDVKPWTAFDDGQRPGGASESALAGGYFWLAYDPDNYAAACKPCNSTYKSTYFPIDARRGRMGAPIAELADERPLLCLPIGETDADPESLIAFDATIAIPNPLSETFQQRRGRAIIQLFLLNGRQDLERERREMIVLLAPYLERRALGSAGPDDLSVVDICLSGRLKHTACCRAYERLWHADPGRAIEIWKRCKTSLFPEENDEGLSRPAPTDSVGRGH